MTENLASLGLNAAKRAAKKVVSEAKRDGMKIPVWKDNQVSYQSPDEIEIEQDDSANGESAGASSP